MKQIGDGARTASRTFDLERLCIIMSFYMSYIKDTAKHPNKSVFVLFTCNNRGLTTNKT